MGECCKRCGIELSVDLLRGYIEPDGWKVPHTDARCADRLAARLREVERIAREALTKIVAWTNGRSPQTVGGTAIAALAALDAATKGGGT